jgi:DnaK suppressor protein
MKAKAGVSAQIDSRRARGLELKRSLEARRRELAVNHHERMRVVRAEHGTHALGGGLDDGDISEIDIQEDIELRLIQMKAEILKRIDESIARLNAGVYGYCSSCGEEIAMARLRALPFAVRCRECEEQDETERRRARTDQEPIRFGTGMSES